MSYKKIIFIISFLAVFGLMFTPLEIAGPWQTNKESESLTGFNFNAPTIQAMTIGEIQALIHQLQQQINQLQQQLQGLRDEVPRPYPFEWGWEVCTPERPCTVGQGDCDRDADCAPGLFCAQNVGAKYGQHPLMDVCERKEPPAKEDIPLIFSKYYTIATPRITPEEIFHYNPTKDSGWFYIAQTIPENGIAFWAAPMRTLSTTPTDNSAPLLYGITNINTGEYYAGFLPDGSFSESVGKIDLFYQWGGEKLIEFSQTKTDLSEFKLKVNLPWNEDFFRLERTLTLSRPILYPSGDGIIPMAEGIESLYASIVTDQGFWIDFQKFNVGGKPLPRETNHRWGCFILNKPVGILPAGTIGVGWEILDENNQRQPGGFTNVDLIVPGFPQFTATEPEISMGEIEVIETWDSNNKTYLRKWKMSYPGGIELLFETVIPNQENVITITTQENVTINHYFYEGMIRVIDPQTGEVVGTGMLEQTHDEASAVKKFEWGWEACTPERPCAVGQGDCDRDADCAPGLFCAQNVGAKYGQHPLMDVCEVKPSITVISPNGGERWVIGHRYDITWKSVGDVGMIDILLVDHRVSPSETVIATNIPAPAGKYSWTIPRDITPGENAFTISIRGKAINDSSDHYFSILQPIVPQPIVPPCDSYGDVNADGFVTKADATLVSEYVVNKITLTEEQKRKADVNQDGTITIVDAMMISQFAERIRDTLPACVKLSPCPPYGDVNHNKYVNLMDSFLIAEFVVGRITLTPAEQERADVNQDGTVTIVDAMMISQYVKGERDTFPVCGDEAKNIITPTCEYLLRGIQDNFMTQCGDANYNPVFDLNKDKIINISDFGLIVANQDNEAWCREKKACRIDPCIITPTFTPLGLGARHTCKVFADGTVKCWGNNEYGQLGDGTTIDRHTPVLVSGITTAVAVTGAFWHTCALLSDGTIKCWGWNMHGQLGDGTTIDRHTPVLVSGITTAIAIDNEDESSCALLSDGTIKCWGDNSVGQLGDGTTINRHTPVLVSGITTAIAITNGEEFNCALLADGTVKCWGANWFGSLGDGTTIDRYTPVLVSGITTAVAISAGGYHACAVLSDGTVKCWGWNVYGQLGDGTTINRHTPVLVSGITTAVAVFTGLGHTCALLTDGTIKCWGKNFMGTLGDGTTIQRHTPVLVSGITTAITGDGGFAHTCALLSDGTVKCWGDNLVGQLGDGTTIHRHTPVLVNF